MIVEVAVFASIRDENGTRNLHLFGGPFTDSGQNTHVAKSLKPANIAQIAKDSCLGGAQVSLHVNLTCKPFCTVESLQIDDSQR